MKLQPTKLCFYEYQKQRFEDELTKILKNKYMNDKQKNWVRQKYQKKIDELDFKIKKERMKSA